MKIIACVTNVNKTYKTSDTTINALQPSTLTLNLGELVLIIGPSGLEKTTFLSMFGCVIYPTSVNKLENTWELAIRYRFAGNAPFVPVNKAEISPIYPQVIFDYNQFSTKKLDTFSQLSNRIDKKRNFKKIEFNIFLDIQNALATKTLQPTEFGLNRVNAVTFINSNCIVAKNS